MATKRKSHPVVAESPAKRQASQGLGDISGGEEEEEEQGWERRAGMIMEVSMRNFMCHEVRPSHDIYRIDSLVLEIHLSTQPAPHIPLWRERDRQDNVHQISP